MNAMRVGDAQCVSRGSIRHSGLSSFGWGVPGLVFGVKRFRIVKASYT